MTYARVLENNLRGILECWDRWNKALEKPLTDEVMMERLQAMEDWEDYMMDARQALEEPDPILFPEDPGLSGVSDDC